MKFDTSRLILIDKALKYKLKNGRTVYGLLYIDTNRHLNILQHTASSLSDCNTYNWESFSFTKD